MTMDLHKKIEKEKNQEPKKWSLKKKHLSVKDKKTNSSTVLPILFESRKESLGSFSRNP